MTLRKVEVTVVKDREALIIDCLQDRCSLTSLVALHGFGTTVFQFYTSAERLPKILAELERIECGVTFGLIVVLPLSMIKPKPAEETPIGIQHRLPIEEVYDRICQMSQPGFNEWLFILVAASIASLGLIFDSTTTVISSMLLSPLMDPLVGVIFATVIRDRKLFVSGLSSFVLEGCVVLLIGFCFGLGFSYWCDELGWPTSEMTSRGSYTSVISGSFVAFPSGIAVALCMTNGGVNPLVGAAISASILPPIANAGILWAFSSVGTWVAEIPQTQDYGIQGAYSLALFFANVFFIFIAAYMVFVLKTVTKYQGRSEFYDDIPRISGVPQDQRPWNKVRANLQQLAQIGRERAQMEAELSQLSVSSQEPRPSILSQSYTTPNFPKLGHRRSRSLFASVGSDFDEEAV